MLSTQCAKRATQPVPNGEKVEIDKKDLLELVGKDLEIDEEEARKERFQTELLMPGDRIQLTIYEKLPVSQEGRIEMKRIDEEGKVFLLPIGEIKLQGLRIAEAEHLIEKKFSELVVSPHCEIQIIEKQYEPRVYVFGEVTKSGSVPFKSGDRLLDAISLAQGCSDNAYKRSIKVVRMEKEKVSIYSLNLNDIFNSGNLYKNIQLRDQDIVFVPRRFMTGFKEVFSALALVVPWYVLVQSIYR
jgi:protein involved in polysaccharide export with SLBB domain